MANVGGRGCMCAVEGEGGAAEGWRGGGADSFLCFLGRIEHRAATQAERASYAWLLLEGLAFKRVCF